MKDKAITYLMKNPLLHMGMIEPIRRNTANILYADKDGVLLKEQKSSVFMISVDNFEKGQKLVNRIPKCNLIVVHQIYMVDYILNKFVIFIIRIMRHKNNNWITFLIMKTLDNRFYRNNVIC